MQFVYTGAVIVGGEVTHGTPTSLTRLIICLIALVPPNVIVSQENLALHVEYVFTHEANSIEVTTITNK
jgi:hypothetical protein